MAGKRWAAGSWSWRPAALRLLRFELRALLLAALGYGLVFAATPLTVPTTRAAEPRVVIIVGPAGRATDSYRADGDAAAAAARAAGAEVTTIYSPDATWPLVRDALQGASIVAYMGHGNGFPSPYGPILRKTTKDGLGLNPVAGVDDVAHQYFGEAYLARYIRLAPHAVVLLHHLCYASGNSEPGLPEGDLETARQRVDNMAAGWLAAGAEAVLAEAYDGPAHYVERILAGEGTIESIWRTGPTAHGHVLAFASRRTPGYTALLDPTQQASGFYRSLVARAELRADEVAAGAALVGETTVPVASPAPSPSPRVGPTVETMTLSGVPTAGSSAQLGLSLSDPGTEPLEGLGIGVRWDPLALDPAPMIAATRPPNPTPSPSVAPIPSPPAEPTQSAEPTPPVEPTDSATSGSADQRASTLLGAFVARSSAGVDTTRLDAPPVTLISPEIPGAVVDVTDVDVSEGVLAATLTIPLEPGLYRLVATVHDADGVAFEAPTQERIPALVVRVTGVLSSVIAVTDRLDVAAGATVDLPVRVANTGSLPWVREPQYRAGPGSQADIASGAWGSRLVGQWLRLDAPGETVGTAAVRATVRPEPGDSEHLVLTFRAPRDPGAYLLVLDVVSPLYGSLTAATGTPVAVRVAVRQAPESKPPTVP